MSKEQLQPNPLEFFSKVPPEKFSQVCDGLVDFQISPQLLIDTVNSIKDGRIIALVTTHQSYFEIETQRRFCQELNKISPKPISTFLFYSAPAVESNISSFFELRKPVYDECYLNMLGIIREEDRSHPKYKNNITKEMEKEHRENIKTMIEARKQGGCIFIIPLESKLDSGRINPQTGKINGIKATNTDEGLTRMVKKKALIISCGIDGGYKVFDPNYHSPTSEFIKSFSFPSSEKLVTFKADKLIDPSQEYPGESISDICHQIIIEVAKNVSPDAQGYYQQFC